MADRGRGGTLRLALVVIIGMACVAGTASAQSQPSVDARRAVEAFDQFCRMNREAAGQCMHKWWEYLADVSRKHAVDPFREAERASAWVNRLRLAFPDAGVVIGKGPWLGIERSREAWGYPSGHWLIVWDHASEQDAMSLVVHEIAHLIQPAWLWNEPALCELVPGEDTITGANDSRTTSPAWSRLARTCGRQRRRWTGQVTTQAARSGGT
jgi:hypothetical protein